MKILHHEIGRDKLYKIWNAIPGAMIIYTYTEGGSIVFADKIFPITRGTLCYIGPAIPHYTVPDVPALYDRSKLFLSADTVSKLLNVLPESNDLWELFSKSSVIYAQIPEELMGEVEAIFDRANRALTEQNGMEEIAVSAFFELMVYLKRYAIRQLGSPNSFLPKAVDYINRHYSEPITLDDVCRTAFVSKYYFCRRFKDMMGMTVMEYICQTRLSAAKGMLLHTDLRIEEIAERCGFSGPSYFSQIFKKRVGMSATAYRRTGERSDTTA